MDGNSLQENLLPEVSLPSGKTETVPSKNRRAGRPRKGTAARRRGELLELPHDAEGRLTFERAFWREAPGAILAGVDEAGRGCLAGPVVAGAVSIDAEVLEMLASGELAPVNDSKQLTPKKRDELFEIMTHRPEIRWAVGMASAAEIDRINILRATHLAMRRAVEGLPVLPARALVDGLPVKGLPVPHDAIVKGDARSLLIACASIVAKVTRDRLCVSMDAQYPGYGFAAHKAYGTKAHLKALKALGPCSEHRRSFAPVLQVLADDTLPGLL